MTGDSLKTGGRGFRRACTSVRDVQRAGSAEALPSQVRVGVKCLSALGLTAVMFMAPSVARACSVCAGDPASPMTAGMNSAIVTLLLITGTVLTTFISFFIFLWRRAYKIKRASSDTAWLDGLRGAKNV